MKCFKTFLAAAAASIAMIGNAHADERDFTLVNGTPWTIDSLYVKLPGSNDWGSDVLGSGTLSASYNTDIHWNGYGRSSYCDYDVMVVFAGSPPVDIHWDDVHVCDISTMTIYYDFSSKMYRARWD